MITSTAWPSTPPPAQPDMHVKPIDDVGAVGMIQASPTSDMTDVVMDLINQVKPNDLAQVEPLSAMRWRDVERIVLPPQHIVDAYMPIDMRVTRWELYQDIRHVPVMSGVSWSIRSYSPDTSAWTVCAIVLMNVYHRTEIGFSRLHLQTTG